MAKTRSRAPKRRSPVQGCLSLVVLFVVIVVVIAAATGSKSGSGASGSGASGSAPRSSGGGSTGGGGSGDQHTAKAYISQMHNDINTVQASVQSVQIAVALVSKDASTDNVNQLAQLAQQAHDSIDGVRQDFANTNTTSGSLGNAELEVFTAANDLKNAMGAVVAYTGNPNPATLAHFTTQYQNAVGEWNDGVQTIWSTAGEAQPPTL